MSDARHIPRIVVAAAASNTGKTTIAAGLIAAFRGLGLSVQPFKCGPDYIDPTYHERAAQRPCRNLDAWMLDDRQLVDGFVRACADADVAVIEGVMGLFDGCGWQDERGSTAQLAKLLSAPVLLVVDVAGAARSAAVTVLGCRQFDPELDLRAVALNFAGSEGHAAGCSAAIVDKTGLPVLGWLPRDPRLRIPERHLGLTPGGERPDTDALISLIAAQVAQRFDVSALLKLAQGAAPLPPSSAGTVRSRRAVPSGRAGQSRPKLAVARDEAFCFYYPENLELLAQAGAAIEFFSPLRGERPGADVAGVYLGGGYPELHGAALASNVDLWRSLKELHAADAVIYAECGGFMALTQGLIDLQGHSWPMAGLIPGVTRMSEKLAALGYRQAIALVANPLTDQGQTLRGHEFRYSSWESGAESLDHSTAWRVCGTRDTVERSVGYVRGNLLASYLHVHFGQREDIAHRFVDRLRAASEPHHGDSGSAI